MISQLIVGQETLLLALLNESFQPRFFGSSVFTFIIAFQSIDVGDIPDGFEAFRTVVKIGIKD